MAKTITFSEAVSRFGPLMTTNVVIEDAIREAVTRIYEMGRWPGTTEEIELDETDFTLEDNEYFLLLDETEYDGMIGFRNRARGWEIMDQTILYKNKLNGGDLALIDMGTIEVASGDGVVYRRKYRMPLDFNPSSPPFYILMKLEAPELSDDTIIPIHSIGALKAAITAVSYEMVNDEDRANVSWQKFNQLMVITERQVEGPKRYFVGMDSSLRRKPNQFM